jgi:phage/plasmid-like protein (TIGR03299 family)
MAHNITETDSLFTVREPAWHGLGTVLPEYPTRAEAQKLAHNWEPVASPLYRKDIVVGDDGSLSETFVPVETHHEITRSDNHQFLGVTTTTSSIVTNTEMYDIAEALQDGAKDVKFETGGSLKGGAKVWLLLKLDEPLLIKGDTSTATKMYYALQNNNDGNGSFRGQATATRIVCDNTAQMADLDAAATGCNFIFQHTSSIAQRIEDAKVALRGWRTSVNEYRLRMEHLATVRVTAEQIGIFRDTLIPMPDAKLVSDRVKTNVLNARSDFDLVLAGPTSEGIAETSYGLLQAAIEYGQHYRGTRAKTELGRIENRFQRAYLDPFVYTSSAVEILDLIGAS